MSREVKMVIFKPVAIYDRSFRALSGLHRGRHPGGQLRCAGHAAVQRLDAPDYDLPGVDRPGRGHLGSAPALHCPDHCIATEEEANCTCSIGKPFQDILEVLLVIRQVHPALPLRETRLPRPVPGRKPSSRRPNTLFCKNKDR